MKLQVVFGTKRRIKDGPSLKVYLLEIKLKNVFEIALLLLIQL